MCASQGVYKRHLNGNASAANANEALAMAKKCARLGVEALHRYQAACAAPTAAMLHAFRVQKEWSSNQGGVTEKVEEPEPLYPPLVESMASQRAKDLLRGVSEFMLNHILPLEAAIIRKSLEQPSSGPESRWTISPHLENLKAEARARGLWNLFLPRESDQGRLGAGLTNLEYAAMAEVMGRSLIAPEVFNCSAPDTGNMEVGDYGFVHVHFISELFIGMCVCKTVFLTDSLALRHRRTEAAVSAAAARRKGEVLLRHDRAGRGFLRRHEHGGHHHQRGGAWRCAMFCHIAPEHLVYAQDTLVLNGHKWWISGAMDPRCAYVIFMGRSSVALPAHRRHSMVIVPMDAPGIEVLRPMTVFGFDDAPHGE
jgi:acyl-CoA dehydrogenase